MADPVAVDAGLMAEARAVAIEALGDECPNMDICGMPAGPMIFESVVDAAYAALQAAEKRGAERMQERAAKVCDDYLVRMAETIARRTEAGKPSFVAECKEDAAESLAAAIRALPTDKET